LAISIRKQYCCDRENSKCREAVLAAFKALVLIIPGASSGYPSHDLLGKKIKNAFLFLRKSLLYEL
jgi:hypothetical protein